MCYGLTAHLNNVFITLYKSTAIVVIRVAYTHIDCCIMYPSTFKGKEPANSKVTRTTASLQNPGGADDHSAMMRKIRRCRQRRDNSSDLVLFSDSLDGTSSDEQSFDDDDMFGSDSDAQTISLPLKPNSDKNSCDKQIVCIGPSISLNTLISDTG